MKGGIRDRNAMASFKAILWARGSWGIHLPSGQGMEYVDERQEKQTSLAKAPSERHPLRQLTGGMGQAEFKAWAEEEPTALENRPDSKEQRQGRNARGMRV